MCDHLFVDGLGGMGDALVCCLYGGQHYTTTNSAYDCIVWIDEWHAP